MDPKKARPFTVPGAGAAWGTGTGTEREATGTRTEDGPLFDHEKLEVYQVAREYFRLAASLLSRKVPIHLRDQLERASSSILFNIGEGAGKTAGADKRRSYEIARGSTTEAATQLEILHLRGLITSSQYQQARVLLVRVAQMLSRLCGVPRRS